MPSLKEVEPRFIALWSVHSMPGKPLMSTLHLKSRIREQGLPDPVARTFREELLRVACLNGPMKDAEAALIRRLFRTEVSTATSTAPFDALWSCSALFLEACITVAVTGDGYTVEKARHVSQLAHRLGFSARQLSDLERSVICALTKGSRGASAAGAL